MVAFLLRRLVLALLTVWLISVVSFAIIVVPPGDFATQYAARLARTEGVIVTSERYGEMVKELRALYNLDKPVTLQYLNWAWDILHGDFGLAYQPLGTRVIDQLKDRAVNTLMLAGATILFTWIMAIPIGIYSAVRQHTTGDYIVTFVGFLGLAVPDFLLGLTLLWFVFVQFDVLLSGLNSPEFQREGWGLARLWDLLQHMWIPALVLGTSGTAGLIRIMRNNLLDELRKPYVVTARAKGVPEWKVVVKYPVRVALNPVISGIGYVLPALFSGSIIVSVVLNLPTIGPVLLRALQFEDTYMAAGSVLILGVLTVIGILLSDILLALSDPRVKIETV